VEADIIFNNQIARFTTIPTNLPDSYYLEGVLSHEIGHMIGLDHIDSPTSIMKEDSPMEESWLKGSIDDETLAAIDRLYSNKPTKVPPRFEYGM
jgi:predicted Zn-dependent protease